MKAFENMTTPFKGMVCALIAAKLVSLLGMGDADANAVAGAAWMVLTAALAYAVPADFGSAASAKIAAWVLARVLPKAVPVLFVVAAASLGGCAAQQGGATQPRDLRGDCRIAEVVFAGFQPMLAAKCSQAKDPVKDGYCLGLVGGNTAIAACYAAAARGSASGVDQALDAVPVPPAT